LKCDGCECGRGYVSKELRGRLENFFQKHGWPDGPIILRTGEVHKPEQRAIAAETELKRKTKGSSKMKMRDLFPSKYLRAADLQGKPRTVVIDHVSHEAFKDDGKDVQKAILHFKGNGTAPMVVNKTNFQMLVAITGYDDDAEWSDEEIELYSTKVQGPGGKVVDSVRIREAA
jgi:hypothetical protein